MSYYSIISISSHSHLGELFNIGLLCIDKDKAYFHFSESKAKIILKLFPKHSESLFRSTMKSIVNLVNEFNAEPKSNTELLEPIKRTSELSRKYFNYLSRYNNNLIQFSEPKDIDLDINQAIFEKLFQKYIYSDEVFNKTHIKKVSDFDKYYPDFLERAKVYVNTNFKVTNQHFSQLITPKRVDMIGKNGAINIAHSVNFNSGYQSLKRQLDSYMYLALSTELTENKEATCFLIGEEPEKDSRNHEVWQNVRKLREIEYVSFDEREKVIDHFKREGISPMV